MRDLHPVESVPLTPRKRAILQALSDAGRAEPESIYLSAYAIARAIGEDDPRRLGKSLGDLHYFQVYFIRERVETWRLWTITARGLRALEVER